MQLTLDNPILLTKELKPIGNDIVLGIFAEKTFKYLEGKGFLAYKDFCDWSIGYSIIEHVKNACIICHRIIFILDGVHFPINTNDSLTCLELEIICENDNFFRKTVFVKGDNIINFDRHLVIN